MGDLDEIARQVMMGDSMAFSAIVTATSARYYRLAARMLGDEAEAQDSLQDAYLRIYDALRAHRFDGRSGVETWMYRIVANVALDALRARRRGRARSALAIADARSADGQRDADARVALRELAALMGRLPPDQRAVLVLKEVEGLSSAEVARVLGCSEGAVEQRLVRARQTLRAGSTDD